MPRLLTLAEAAKARRSGYTRLLRCGHRRGDNAPMAILEYVDQPDKITVRANEAAREQALIRLQGPQVIAPGLGIKKELLRAKREKRRIKAEHDMKRLGHDWEALVQEYMEKFKTMSIQSTSTP